MSTETPAPVARLKQAKRRWSMAPSLVVALEVVAVVATGLAIWLAVDRQDTEPSGSAPASCLAALDAADTRMAVNTEVALAYGDLLDQMTPSAVGIVLQADDLDTLSNALDVATQRLDTADYSTPALACRGAR